MAVRGNIEEDPYVMLIVDDILIMTSNLQCTEFLFNKRDENKIVHTLVHLGTFDSFEKFWSGKIPESCKHWILEGVRREPTIFC